MKTSPRYILALVGVLLWMTLVLLLYYWIHKPVTSSMMQALGGAALDIGVAFILVALGGDIGRVLVKRFFAAEWGLLSKAERLAGEAMIGLTILSVAIFVVGLVKLSLLSMLLLLVGISGLLRRNVLGWAKDGFLWLQQLDINFGWGKGLAVFIVFNLILVFMMAVVPPTKFDSLTYQLVGPQLWVQEGKFTALPNNHFFGFPQYVNTLYAGHIAVMLGRFTGTASIHAFLGVLTLMAVGGYGARRFNPFVGLASVAILLSATSIWLQFSWAYVDLVSLAAATLTFAALEIWKETHKQNFLILAGIFAGIALSSKYNAAMVGFAGGLYILWYGWQKGLPTLIKAGLIFGIAAFIVLSPWLIRNVLFYDNPVYPLGPATGDWDELSNDWYFYGRGNLSHLKDEVWMIALLPFTPTFLGIEGGAPFSATIGPLFVLLIPLLLLTWGRMQEEWRTSLKGLLWFLVFMHLFWLYSMTNRWTETRLVLSIFPTMAILAAVALDSLRLLPEKPLNIGWMLRTVVALVFLMTAVNHVAGIRPKEDEDFQGTTMVSHFVEMQTLEYLLGMVSKQDYLETALGWHITAMDKVSDLPRGSHILFLWETRSLYCDETTIICEEDPIIMRWWHDRRAIGTAEEIIDSWRGRGVTHVLVWETGRDFEFENNELFEAEDEAEWEKAEELLEVTWRGADVYTLYKLPQ